MLQALGLLFLCQLGFTRGVCTPTPRRNLLVNPSFEKTQQNSDGSFVPQGWKLDSRTALCSEAARAFRGRYYLDAATNVSGVTATFSQQLTNLDTSQFYELNFQSRVVNTSGLTWSDVDYYSCSVTLLFDDKEMAFHNDFYVEGAGDSAYVHYIFASPQMKPNASSVNISMEATCFAIRHGTCIVPEDDDCGRDPPDPVPKQTLLDDLFLSQTDRGCSFYLQVLSPRARLNGTFLGQQRTRFGVYRFSPLNTTRSRFAIGPADSKLITLDNLQARTSQYQSYGGQIDGVERASGQFSEGPNKLRCYVSDTQGLMCKVDGKPITKYEICDSVYTEGMDQIPQTLWQGNDRPGENRERRNCSPVSGLKAVYIG